MNKFVVLDIETNSLSISKAVILQWAAVYGEGHDRDSNMFYLRPPTGVEISESAYKVHGINSEFLSQQPKDLVKDYVEGVSLIYDQFRKGYDKDVIFVGHNINKFDMPILLNAFNTVLNKQIDIRSINMVDTGMLYLAHAFSSNRVPQELETDFYDRIYAAYSRKSKWNLAHCIGSDHFKMYPDGVPHTANFDAHTCYKLFMQMRDSGQLASVLGGRYAPVGV